MTPAHASQAPAPRPDDHPGPPPPSDRPRWLNLGVLAHVDAGKTSLTEALLHQGGALDRVGRVDDGTTQTDSLALERRRGITIRTAVATFRLDDVTVNLVDTPGHPDFIAEVDRSLVVLDAAVLVVSAVEGVQAQTVVLCRALRRLGVPAVVFVNKVDRLGAAPERVLAAVARRLPVAVVPLGVVDGPGTPAAAFRPSPFADPAVAERVTALLAEHDDDLLGDWVRSGRPARPDRLWKALGRLTRRGVVHPLLLGSARTGAGLPELVGALTGLLPPGRPDPGAPVSGQVFKVERSEAGERVCSVRLRTGALAVRDRVPLGPGRAGTVTALEVHEPGGAVPRPRAEAGQVVRVHGLDEARVGDRLGHGTAALPAPSFPPPALQTTVVARDPARRGELYRALRDLADVDPLIRLRPGGRSGDPRISVYGEVQQEVIADTLATGYGVAVDFEATGVVCVERPAGRAMAVRRVGDPGHRYACTLGLSVEPVPPGGGVELRVEAPHASLPLHVYDTVEGFRTAVLGYLAEPLAAGPHGWAVTDLRVTVTESGYPPAGPPAADVRHTVAVVVAEALARAGTVVCEPVDRFRVETPDDTVPAVLTLLARHRGVPDAPRSADGVSVLTGTVPTAGVDPVRRALHTAAHGEAVMESALDSHRPRLGGGSRHPDPAGAPPTARRGA